MTRFFGTLSQKSRRIFIKDRNERNDKERSVLCEDEASSELAFIDNISLLQREELGFVAEPEDNPDASPFLFSLDNLEPEDIPLSKEPKKPSPFERLFEILRVVLLVISIGVFVVCAVLLVENLIEKQKANELYSALASEFDFSALTRHLADGSIPMTAADEDAAVAISPPLAQGPTLTDMTTRIENDNSEEIDTSEVEIKKYNAEIEAMKAQIQSLTLRNPDTYGWIYVPGTSIDYQVVQGTDNDYYLGHSTDGSALVVGSIFADYRNNKSILKNFNTVFYGHNITDGTMFNHVTKFLKEDCFNNTLIYVYTKDGAYVYEPFAIYKAQSDYQYFRTEFTSTDDFIQFAEEMQKNSLFTKNMTFAATDRIITLSTCTNGAVVDRYCLQAKLVSIIQ